MYCNTTLVIAEAGVNHNGSIDLAKKLIDEASNAGADIIKFQSYNTDLLTTKSAKKANYQKNSNLQDESQFDMLRKYELNKSDHIELQSHCNKKNISFLSTPFDTDSVKMLAGLGMRLFKVPSGEVTNLPYLRLIGSYGLPVILSTGMCTFKEVEQCVEILLKSGLCKEKLTILHCNTEYPTPFNDVNLNVIPELAERFGVNVGYSDHTKGIEVAIAAVALGARVIEKHFTLDKCMNGPDHAASINPEELKLMISSIRNIEESLGDKIKKITKSEEKNLLIVRKSIVASTYIKEGDFFSENNITVKRPGTGLSPMHWDKIIGYKANKNYKANDFISI